MFLTFILTITSLDVRLFLHKVFRVKPPSWVGLPHFSINCYQKNLRDFRFDWIINDNDMPIQVCALIEIYIGHRNESIFLYAGLVCDQVTEMKDKVINPFPLIKYSFENGKRSLKAVLGRVDTIAEPAFVVPTDIYEANYIKMDIKLMKETYFCIVPLPFMMRDGYGDMDFTETLKITKTSKTYIDGSRNLREKVFDDLLRTLKRNNVNITEIGKYLEEKTFIDWDGKTATIIGLERSKKYKELTVTYKVMNKKRKYEEEEATLWDILNLSKKRKWYRSNKERFEGLLMKYKNNS